MNKLLYIIVLLNINLIYSLQSSISFLTLEQFKHRNRNNKVITLSPAGLAGFYLLGIVKYIKENYDISEYTILGASAGAWCSIPMVYKDNITDITENLINNYCIIQNYNPDDNIDDIFNNNDYYVDEGCNIKSIYQLQCNIKSILLDNYSKKNFNLNKLNIATTIFTKSGFKQIIISDIKSLDQVTDSCFASSHIPFITGKGLLKVHDKVFFDGGFKLFPPAIINPYFEIKHTMWGFNMRDILNIKKYNDPSNVESLLIKGFEDSKTNKHILNKYFKQL
tara:strand:- start:17644 stop:18480 length:837 start_codon:yes stop_codon:yes gene_type:complete